MQYCFTVNHLFISAFIISKFHSWRCCRGSDFAKKVTAEAFGRNSLDEAFAEAAVVLAEAMRKALWR